MKLIQGHLVGFDDDRQFTSHRRGVVAIEGGRIVALGDLARLRADYPDAPLTDHGDAWVLPGFVDAHVHYPQLGVIASHGRELLEWLTDYTFPEEMRFHDPAYARVQADAFWDELTRNGTTSAAVFSTVHPVSADALFASAQARGHRVMTGKVMMDRHCPPALADTAQSAYDDSEALIRRWHGVDRLDYALTPRFAPTSTPEQLAACTALWDCYPDVALQTHLSENRAEIEWVKQLFPGSPDYVGVYEDAGLVRARSLFGHAIHLNERERAVLKDAGAALVHCPTSNLFLGSGLFEFQALLDAGQSIALATDVGGGTSFSMLATMKAAYQVSAMAGRALDIEPLWYSATLGAARSLGWANVGNVAVGFEADLVVIDPTQSQVLAQRVARADSLREALFATAILADDRHVVQTYLA